MSGSKKQKSGWKKSKKPVIGITGPDKGGNAAWFFTSMAVRAAGGQPVRITPGNHNRAPSSLEGLIIGGGADVDPTHYGQEKEKVNVFENENGDRNSIRVVLEYLLSLLFYPFFFLIRKIYSTKSSPIDQQRDKMELAFLEKALEQQLPVLGICRGAQLINIYFGGSLHQNLANFYADIPQITSIFPKKKIYLEEDSHLHQILQSKEPHVNALHKQAINILGKGLRAVAYERSGVIQAIEHPSFPFVIGVQWHPEYLPQKKVQRKLFRDFIKSCH